MLKAQPGAEGTAVEARIPEDVVAEADVPTKGANKAPSQPFQICSASTAEATVTQLLYAQNRIIQQNNNSSGQHSKPAAHREEEEVPTAEAAATPLQPLNLTPLPRLPKNHNCLLYTSDAADE